MPRACLPGAIVTVFSIPVTGQIRIGCRACECQKSVPRPARGSRPASQLKPAVNRALSAPTVLCAGFERVRVGVAFNGYCNRPGPAAGAVVIVTMMLMGGDLRHVRERSRHHHHFRRLVCRDPDPLSADLDLSRPAARREIRLHHAPHDPARTGRRNRRPCRDRAQAGADRAGKGRNRGSVSRQGHPLRRRRL